ncbi:hypothetical protein VTO42DRAFT_3493 [Malbranchea cinnamomea]
MGDFSQRDAMLPPLSVQQITDRASDFEFNSFVPLHRWIRAANSLVNQATIYEREGNDQQAYLLLYRHAQLVLNHIQSHPDAKTKSNRLALAQAQRLAGVSLNKLEELKPRIAERYERYVRSTRERTTRSVTPSQAPSYPLSTPDPNEYADPALAGRARPLTAAEHKDLAVQLAVKELRRRATKRDASVKWNERVNVELAQGQPTFYGGTDEGDDLFRRLQDVKSKMDGQRARHTTDYSSNKESYPDKSSSVSTYQYPTVPPKTVLKERKGAPPVPCKEPLHSIATSPPPLPPRVPPVPAKLPGTPLRSDTRLVQQPPPVPDKVLLESTTDEREDRFVNGQDTLSPNLHPSIFTFKPSSYLENGTPLRTIFVSPDLRKKFLSIAAPNTRRNLETCGILCGTLISNAFFISKLVIPEQESTSDTCEMVNEAAVFEFCDAEDLMVLGWIHTHPTQTCFMSSRDLHTQSGFQAMLAESIAIVCAPSKDPDWGVFRLTDPPGLKSVLSCTQTGIFHPHGDSNIYTDALRPGHVFEAPGLEFDTVDLRSGVQR